MGNFQHKNGKYYKTSDAPGTAENIIYSEGRSDDPYALNIQRPTGRMVKDLNNKIGTVYTINKGYDEDITGARISKEGRKQRRDSISALLHNSLRIDDRSKAEELFYNEYGQGEFANLFRKDGNLRRRAFRNQDFLNTIASREYSTNDVYRPSENRTLGDNASGLAENINNIVNPTLIKKTTKGRFVDARKEYKVPKTRLVRKTVYPFGCRSVECGVELWLPETTMETRYRDGHRWEKAQYDNINSSAQSKDIYGEKPEMADFHALPLGERKVTTFEEREQTIPEITPIEKAREYVTTKKATTEQTSTGNSQQPNKVPINITKQTKKKKETTTVNTTNTNTSTTSFKEQRPITITYLEDGTPISTEHGEWTRVNQ